MGFKRGVPIDVHQLQRDIEFGEQWCQRNAHVITQVAVGPHQQRQRRHWRLFASPTARFTADRCEDVGLAPTNLQCDGDRLVGRRQELVEIGHGL